MLNLTIWIFTLTGLVPLIYVQSVIVVNTECDGTLDLYADGINSNRKSTNQSLNISIPDDTKVVAVTCRHTDGPAGMRLTFSKDIKREYPWKCYYKFVDGWYETGFNDDAWPKAVVIKDNWIWTAKYPQDDTVYCRRVIALEAITGQAVCENNMDFYADGVLYKSGNISIPGDTQLVAIKCKNTGGPAGIKMTLSNGIETSAEWKCYNKHEQGWNEPGFNDDTWPNAVVVSDEWIWTDGFPQDKTVFCRKDFDDRTVVDSDNSSVQGCLKEMGIAVGVCATLSIIIILTMVCCHPGLIFAMLLIAINILGLTAVGLSTYYLCDKPMGTAAVVGDKPMGTGAVVGIDFVIYFIEKLLDALLLWWAKKMKSSDPTPITFEYPGLNLNIF